MSRTRHESPAQRRRGAVMGALALCVAVAACVAVARQWPAGDLELVIRSVRTGTPLTVLPLAPGEPFTLRYLHSVDGTPVWEEHYADAAGHIYIGEERFVMLGAGMGHWPGHGTLTLRDSVQVIEHIDRRIGEFIVRVGDEQVDQTMTCGDQVVRLGELAPGQAVTISVEPIRRLDAVRRRLARRSDFTDLAER